MPKILHIRLTLLLRVLQASQATRAGRPRCGISHTLSKLSDRGFVVSNVDDPVALYREMQICVEHRRKGLLVVLKAEKAYVAHHLTCGNLGPGKYLLYELRDRLMVALRGKWHCRDTKVELDRHCGFSEQGYRAQLGITCNSQPPHTRMHAVQYLHGSLRERNTLFRALLWSHASKLPNEPTYAPSVLCFNQILGRLMPRQGFLYAPITI